jgi:hypothetical protein
MGQILRKPLFDQIKDENVRDAVQWIWDYLSSVPMLRGQFEHFSLTFTRAVTNEKINHSLGFSPSDIIVTSSIGAGAVTFNYSQFTEDVISLTTTGAVTVRFFGGRYESSNLR